MATNTESKRVFVSGGATGIGRAICVRLAREGHEVAVGYRSRAEEAARVVDEITAAGGRALAVAGDVSDAGAMAAAFAQFQEKGGIQSVVHSASAPLKDARFTKIEWDDFRTHHDVAVKGAFNLARAFVQQAPEAQARSLVFVLSSVTFGVPPAEKSSYTSAKYALLGLARTLAIELASRGIRVNCVSPGFVETQLTAHIDPRVKEMITRSVPLKRLAAAEDVAASVAFLLHADNGYVTGANLPVAGGTVM
ncbi:MAG: hypothetical protein RL077_5733 [Verrucomicrobiota bacterium]|jgi:3-oxoacyl-[acyl-carrier protein] reductase